VFRFAFTACALLFAIAPAHANGPEIGPSNGILWEFENWEPKNFDDDPRVSIDWTEDPLPEP
jgi:hypothetical protein